jgi:hypothetical protein
MLFRYEHAARNWAYRQREWFGRKTKVIELKNVTPAPTLDGVDGARWKVLVD